MYKNIVFDCGQVLVRFDPENIIRCYLTDEDEVKRVKDVIFNRPKPWALLDEDKMSVSEAKEYFAEQLDDPRLVKVACRILDNWMFNLPVINGVYECVEALKKAGKNLYLISNINMTFADRCMEVPSLNRIFSNFSGLVFSAKEALCKPDEKIFTRFLERYNLDAKECIFIDDTQENLEGAKKAGIDGYLFDEDYKKLLKYLLEE